MPSRFRLRLLSSSGQEEARDPIVVDRSIVIGRDRRCDLVLDDASVSRRHAQVDPDADGVRVRDLKSGNGVWQGAESVTDTILAPGHQFRIGSTIFECLAPLPRKTADAAHERILRIVDGGDGDPAGREYAFTDALITIGRSPDCDVVLNEADVSRRHAQLEATDDGVRVTDLDSSCGVWIAGLEVKSALVPAGTAIRIGEKIGLAWFGPAAETGVEDEEAADADATRFIAVADLTPEAAEPVADEPAADEPVPDEPAADADIEFGRTTVMPVPEFIRQGSWRIEDEGDAHDASAHQPFQLDDPDTAYYVVEGGLLLFTVAVEKGQPVGTRSHFLGIVPGQMVFGFDLRKYALGSSFLAVPKQGTKLRKIPRSRLEALATGSASRAVVAGLLDTWIAGLSAALTDNLPAKRTEEQALAVDERVMLESTGKATSAAGVVWIRLWSGSVLFDDMATPRFTHRELPFPLTPDSWIRPVSDEFGALSLKPAATEAIVANHDLWQGLDVFHEVLCESEFVNKKLAQADEFVRLQQKHEHAEAAEEAAYDAIGSVLSSEGSTPEGFRAPGEAEPVLRACQLVGQALGMEVRPHPGAEEGLNYEERVTSIATASGFRTRVVALRDTWYTEDNGPLLGQVADTKAPVALLPTSAKAYECVDPTTGARTPVTEDVAAALSAFAYTFYRPFMEGLLKVPDVVRFGAQGVHADLRWVLYMSIIVGVFGTLTPWFTGKIFDQAIPQSERGALMGYGVALVLAAAATTAFKFTQGVATVRIQTRMSSAIQAGVWDRILNLPVNFFRKYSAGDLTDRAEGVGAIQELISGAGVAAILGSVSGLFYVAQMFGYNLSLALLAILLTGVYVGFNMTCNYLQLRHQRVELQFRGRITGIVLNLLTGVTKIRVAGAEHHAFRVWAEQFARQRRIAFTVGTIQNVATVFSTVYPLISSIAIFAMVISIQQAGQVQFTTGDFIAFNAAYGLFLMAMQALGDASLNLLRVVPIYERLEPILSSPSEVDGTKAFPGKLSGRIELSHVYFRYSADGPWIINDVSLTIEPGEFVAFVGSSGGGKSTLMRLMLGFEQPTRGSVLFDGQDLNALDMRMVRQQMGVVLQASRVMPTEIYRNITGVTSRTIEDAWEAAEKAGLAEDIKNMPMGMHTYVSEGGGTLSGGQRQRLMIARAIVNRPKILFLDEATSALDNRAQNTVTESMDRMDATRIVIAHRLSTVINANRICYLHGGKIAEMGNHQDLMELDGMFAALAKRQMA